jgi:hypothetical protein
MSATATCHDESSAVSDGDALGHTMQTVLDVFRVHGLPMTDEELMAACDLRGGAVRPARLRLHRRGLVEPCGAGAWQLVEPERREEVRLAARARAPRRRGLESLSLDERVATVIALLDDEDVNEAVRARTASGRAWRHASARAREIRAEREQERRARRVAAMKAERLRSPLTAFLKMRNHLKDAVEVLLGLHRLLEEDATQHLGEGSRIPRAVWPDLARNVRELAVAAASVQSVLGGAEATAGDCPVCHRPTGAPVLEYIDGDCVDVPVAGTA